MLPGFKNIPRQSSMVIDSFKGINTTNSYEPGELVECLDVDLVSYPALSSRQKRTLGSCCNGTINGVGTSDGFYYTFYKQNPASVFLSYKGVDYEYTSYTNSNDFSIKRKFATLENAILIIPDNVIFFTDTLSFKQTNISQKIDYTTVNDKFERESLNDDGYTAEKNTAIGNITHNSITSKKISYIPGSHLAYEFYPVAFSSAIEAGDVINIKMAASSPTAEQSSVYSKLVSDMKSGLSLKVKGIEKKNHMIVGGSYITEVITIYFDDQAIDTKGFSDLCFSEINIEKKIPALSALTSFNNRIWGIEGNKVYTSKLGDADEWNDYSVDNYGTLPSSCFSASAGTDGDFTAIISHGNYIYAFKENYIHKVYGDTPDEYTISNLKAPGCIKGSDTLAVCGTYLVYAANEGIFVLRDGYPKLISKNIGPVKPVCAASHGDKYYIICQKEKCRVMYVYDIIHDTWTMQSCSEDADNLCSDSRHICFSEGASLVYINQTDDAEEYEKDIHWSFRLRFDENSFSKNTAIRAMARVTLSPNAGFTVRALYDDDTRGAICGFSYDETGNGSCLLRLPLKRDLGFYLDFKGVGGFSLRNIKFNYYKSSEE